MDILLYSSKYINFVESLFDNVGSLIEISLYGFVFAVPDGCRIIAYKDLSLTM